MNEVVKKNDAMPAYLQGGKTASFGKIDAKDLIVPRMKLMQMTSPELQVFDQVKVGEFFHNILEVSVGKEMRIIPLVLRKEIVLWAPRGDDRGILARSRDCVLWDDGFENLEFEVKHKGMANPVKYYTKGSVAESNLAEFGSMIPGDPKSKPAAAMTYRMLFGSPDHMDWGPFLVINTRSSLNRGRGLITKIELRPVDHFAQVYVMGTTDEQGDEGPYKNYSFTSAGYASEEEYNWAKGLFERFKDQDFASTDEHEDTPVEAEGGAKPTSDAKTRDTSKAAGKF